MPEITWTSQSRRRDAALLLASLLLAGSAHGQTIADAEAKFLPFRGDLADARFTPFWDTLAEAKKEEGRRAIGGSISLGFNGDEANGESLFKLKTGATLSRSFHPVELRFSANLSLQAQDGAIKEDVTQLLVNYDYNYGRYAQYH
jgi:hypothetical protein